MTNSCQEQNCISSWPKRSANGSNTYFLRGAGGELLTEWKDLGTGTGTARDYVYAGSRLLNAVVRTGASDPARGCGPIFGDGSVMTVTAVSGRNPCFTFSGVTGQSVSALLTSVSPSTFSGNWTVSVKRANGTIVGSAATCCTSTLFLDALTLPADETYTLLLDPAGTTSGTVSIQLYQFNHVTGAIVPGGSTVNVSLSVPGQNGNVAFTGTMGQKVSALMTAVSPSTFGNCWYLKILRPDQTQLGSASVCGSATDFLDTVTLPADGPYTLRVDPTGTLTGSVSLQLFAVADVTGSITADGTAVNVALTTPGQKGVLTFTATAGQIVSATMTALSPSTFPNSWSLTLVGPTPAGTIRGSAANACCAYHVAFLDGVTLQDAGAYQLIVDPSATWTGSVAVRLYNVVHDTEPIGTDGTPVTVPLLTPGQNAYLTFTGTQGQRVSLNGTNGTIAFQEWGCDVLVDIRTASNTQVTGSPTCMEVSGFMEPVPLPATGVYTVFVNPAYEAVGNLTLSLYDVPPDLTGSVSVNGGGLPVPIARPGQNGRITFTGTAGQQTTVRVTGNTIPYGTVTLLKPDNSTLTWTYLGAGAFNLPTQTLSAPGTYTIVVNPTTTSTGSLTVAVTSP
jgi:hypothetical protein